MMGIVPIQSALALSRESDLDLVEFGERENPPVCRLLNYGKWKYEQEKKEKQARKLQHQQGGLREMKFRVHIDGHDYETKKGHVERFLQGGDKVKITIMFRGREQSKPELGTRLLKKLEEDLAEVGFLEQAPKQEGRDMRAVFAPMKK